jgi:SAM-dependent methyltransferase
MSQGTGPGAITPDGCAVDFYLLLGPGPDADLIHAAIPVGATILELGSGVGRVTGPLVRLGHPVVAVDESPEMLAHVRDAQTIRASIEDLRLDRRFDVVLLASHLINTPDRAERQAFLDTCARHVQASGCVLIQGHPPQWFDEAGPVERMSAEGITFRLKGVSRPAADLVSATVEYETGDRTWTQSFTARRLTDAALRTALAQAGLALDRYLTDDRSWILARPITPG